MFQSKIQITESESLQLSWGKDWSHFTIKLNDIEIWAFPDKTSLVVGKWLLLPSGKTIWIGLTNNKIAIWDGDKELVSGLNSGESDDYTLAWQALIFYGALFLLAGIVTLSIKYFGIGLDLSLTAILLGVVYIMLALWAYKQYNRTPLYAAITIHGLLSLGILFFSGLNTPSETLFLCFVFVILVLWEKHSTQPWRFGRHIHPIIPVSFCLIFFSGGFASIFLSVLLYYLSKGIVAKPVKTLEIQ